tara:strand:- start:935 stop:1264 length:330 start_codon:yes stop_codon:yes gene_type:complete
VGSETVAVSLRGEHLGGMMVAQSWKRLWGFDEKLVREEFVLFGRETLHGMMGDPTCLTGKKVQEKFLLCCRAVATTLLDYVGHDGRDEKLESGISQAYMRHYGLGIFQK